MARKVQHPQPSGDEQDGRFRHDRQTDTLEHVSQLAPRIGFLDAVRIESHGVQRDHEQRPEKRIVPVRHADDRAPARTQHANDFPDGLFGPVEVLDRTHRVDGIEARIAEREIADVRGGRVQRMRRARKRGHRPIDRRPRDVDAKRNRATIGGPRQDARVPGLVP